MSFHAAHTSFYFNFKKITTQQHTMLLNKNNINWIDRE